MRYTRSSTMSPFFGPEREGTQLMLVESIGPTKSHQTFTKTFRPRLPQKMSSSAIFAHLKHHLLIPSTSQRAFCPRRWISQFAQVLIKSRALPLLVFPEIWRQKLLLWLLNLVWLSLYFRIFVFFSYSKVAGFVTRLLGYSVQFSSTQYQYGSSM